MPVLSSSSVLTSPAASTARPDIASTLRCTSRSMPAMPIADSSAPIVVGIRQTSSETSTMPVTPFAFSAAVSGTPGCCALEKIASGCRVADRQQEDDRQRGEQDVQRDLVRRLLPVGALDQGDHPVDEALARLLGDLHDDPVGQHPGAAGDRGLRSPPDSRITGADSPVIADSSTLAMPSMTSPSPGMISPGLDDHDVALLQLRRRHRLLGCRPGVQSSSRRAMVSVLARRSVSAWALPRPSATASARLANSTVSHSQTVISQANTVGSRDRRARW